MKNTIVTAFAAVAALTVFPLVARADDAPAAADQPANAASANPAETNHGSLGTLSFATVSSGDFHGGGLTFSGGYMWNHFGYDILGGFAIDTASGAQTTERAAGMAAARFRSTVQNKWVGISLAVGPGFVYRAAGSASSFGSLPTDVNGYKSLALNADLAAQLRIGTSTSLAVGVQLWVDGASADGRQATLMPYLGFHWGP